MSTKKVARGLGVMGGGVDAAINADRTVNISADQKPATEDKTTPPAASTSSVVSRLNQTQKPSVVRKQPDTTPAPTEPRQQPAAKGAGERIGVSRKYQGDVVKTSIVLPSVVHDALTEISFHNRKTSKETLNDLFLQGIDKVLGQYGLGSIDKVVKNAQKQAHEV